MIIRLHKERINLIIVCSIIIFLVFSIVIAIKPFVLFRKVRNITRLNHFKLITDTVYFYLMQEGKFPDCIPEFGRGIAINQCPELRQYLPQFPQDPDLKSGYLIEYLTKEKNKIRVYSTSAEAKGIEIVR